MSQPQQAQSDAVPLHPSSQSDIDEIENFNGTMYYTATKGQFMQVSRAKFELIAALPDDGGNEGEGGGNEGGEGEDDGLYTYADATALNKYAQNATSATTSALNSLTNSNSGMAAMQVLYINQAISYVKTSMSNLQDALTILESHVPLDYSSGDHATVADVVRESYALLDAVDELVADTSNYQDVREQVQDAVMAAGPLNLKFQRATVDLLGAFS